MTTLNMRPELLVSGYQDLIDQKICEGWTPYMLTFLFNQLSGSRSTVLNKMTREIERIYATMLTRVVRDPRSPAAVGKLPIWVVIPDLPVPKFERKSLQVVSINEGLHMHAMAVLPPNSRLTEGLIAHVRRYQRLYTQGQRTVLRVHAKRIKYTPAKATAYSLKSLTRRRFASDNIVIFPRASSEMRHEQR